MAHFVTLEHLAQSKHKLNALVGSEQKWYLKIKCYNYQSKRRQLRLL